MRCFLYVYLAINLKHDTHDSNHLTGLYDSCFHQNLLAVHFRQEFSSCVPTICSPSLIRRVRMLYVRLQFAQDHPFPL